jgi:hypothetical protein
MQVQNMTPAHAIASRGQKPARRGQRKLHLPLALTNKPAGQPIFERAQSLSRHELRRIVAGMLG